MNKTDEKEEKKPQFPLHETDWMSGEALDEPSVLVARYREATPNGLSTFYLYAGGPISDPHKLNIAKIRARIHPYGGEVLYMSPDALEAELQREARRTATLKEKGGWSPIPGTPDNDDGEEQRRYEEEAEKLTGDKW